MFDIVHMHWIHCHGYFNSYLSCMFVLSTTDVKNAYDMLQEMWSDGVNYSPLFPWAWYSSDHPLWAVYPITCPVLVTTSMLWRPVHIAHVQSCSLRSMGEMGYFQKAYDSIQNNLMVPINRSYTVVITVDLQRTTVITSATFEKSRLKEIS